MFRLDHQSDNSRSNNNYNAYTYKDRVWRPHFHKNFELICMLRGEMLLTVNESEVILREGEWALILSNQIHSFSVGKSSLAWVAVFSEDFIPEFASFIKDKQGSSVRFSPTEEINELVRENLIIGTSSFLMKRACLYALCDQYLKQVDLELRKNKNDALICRVLDYIETHFHEDITLQTVAYEFGYEYHYLSRLLNRGYSISFKQTLNEYRINHAIDLLGQGGMTVTEIATACGFQSIRSFNDVFLSITGLSPTEYRKKRLAEH